MKRAILFLTLCIAQSAMAAQAPVTQITGITASREALRTQVNTRLSAAQSNFTEIYTALNGAPWLAQTTAPNTYNVFWIDTSGTSSAVKYWDGDSWEVAASGGDGTYTLPTASAETKGGARIGARLTMTGDVLSADVQTTDISGKEDSLGNPSTNGYVLSSTTAGIRSWVNLAGVFAAPLGSDDNYVTDAEKIKLGSLSGTNTGDQDLSGYALISSVLSKTNTTAFTPTADYHPATKKYVDDSITASGGYTDEQAQDAIGAMFSGNTEAGITVTYDDATGKAVFVVATQSDVNFTAAKDAKLADIASGAEANVNADWNASSGDAQILNKPSIPVALSALTDDSTHRLTTDAEKEAWNAKQTALSWLPSVGPTNGRQIMQAIGGCSVETYDTQATCEANAGTWTTPAYVNTSVLSGLINDAGTASDDLLSAAKIITMLAAKQNTLIANTDYLTPATAASTYQVDLAAPDQSEAEAGTSTNERVWTAQRVAQAIAALAPEGVDEIVYQADCSTITNGFCVDTDDGNPWYWNGTAATAISGGMVDLSSPGPIGSVTPSAGNFTTVAAAAFDTSAPATGETGEIGLQEDPSNGNNTITLKAPANLASDVILTLPAGVVPASATAPCTAGQWWFAPGYFFLCVSSNTWQRATLATW